VGAWDAIAGVVLALVGSFAYVTARSFPHLSGGYPGPGLFPQVLGAVLAAAGVALVVGAVAGRRPPAPRPPGGGSRRGRLSALGVVAAVVFFLATVHSLGFVVVSVLILAGLMAALGVPARWNAPVSLAVTAALYILFARILRVPLPEGILRGLL
jgi:putative tricarboxylic transport membrane protein